MPEFTPDGCTNFPDGWWRVCCTVHDAIFWWQPDGISKLDADQAMTECMTALGAPGASLVAAVGLALFAGKYWRRGRRAEPGTEPALLRWWLANREKLRRKPKQWSKANDEDQYPPTV